MALALEEYKIKAKTENVGGDKEKDYTKIQQVGKEMDTFNFIEICDKFLSYPLAQIVKAQAILENLKA